MNRMHRTKLGLIATILLLSSRTTFAAHPLVSDDAGTLGKGNMQLELNGDISREKETDVGSTTHTRGKQLATAFGIGITDKLDLSAGFTRPWGNGDNDGIPFNNAGSADFSLNLKWQLYEQESLTVALKPQFDISYSVGSSDDNVTSYGGAIVFSKELEPFALHLNIGYTYNSYNLPDTRDASRNSILTSSLAGTYATSNRITLVADVGATSSEDKATDEAAVFGLLGAIYQLDKSIDLSAGIKFGLTKSEDDLSGTFGATFKF